LNLLSPGQISGKITALTAVIKSKIFPFIA